MGRDSTNVLSIDQRSKQKSVWYGVRRDLKTMNRLRMLCLVTNALLSRIAMMAMFQEEKGAKKIKTTSQAPSKGARLGWHFASWSHTSSHLHWNTYINSLLHNLRTRILKDAFPDHHHFQQDNDSKHCAHHTQDFFAEKNISWWKAPPESPDLKPIENVWASLKYYLRYQYKPRDLQSLIDGIFCFWNSLTPEICKRYTRHLHKVIPKVIEVEGAASGY